MLLLQTMADCIIRLSQQHHNQRKNEDESSHTRKYQYDYYCLTFKSTELFKFIENKSCAINCKCFHKNRPHLVLTRVIRYVKWALDEQHRVSQLLIRFQLSTIFDSGINTNGTTSIVYLINAKVVWFLFWNSTRKCFQNNSQTSPSRQFATPPQQHLPNGSPNKTRSEQIQSVGPIDVCI